MSVMCVCLSCDLLPVSQDGQRKVKVVAAHVELHAFSLVIKYGSKQSPVALA